VNIDEEVGLSVFVFPFNAPLQNPQSAYGDPRLPPCEVLVILALPYSASPFFYPLLPVFLAILAHFPSGLPSCRIGPFWVTTARVTCLPDACSFFPNKPPRRFSYPLVVLCTLLRYEEQNFLRIRTRGPSDEGIRVTCRCRCRPPLGHLVLFPVLVGDTYQSRIPLIFAYAGRIFLQHRSESWQLPSYVFRTTIGTG